MIDLCFNHWSPRDSAAALKYSCRTFMIDLPFLESAQTGGHAGHSTAENQRTLVSRVQMLARHMGMCHWGPHLSAVRVS